MPDPFSLSLTAGGITQSVAAGCGYGYISQEPDFALTYSTSGFSGLYFYVEGEGDTTLLIRTPNGGWLCDDDSHGNSNPIVDIPNAAQGEYQVWAGAYSSGYIQATLYVSERDPAEATSPPPRAILASLLVWKPLKFRISRARSSMSSERTPPLVFRKPAPSGSGRFKIL